MNLNAVFFEPLGERGIGFHQLQAHDGYYDYRIILKSWPEATDARIEQKAGNLAFTCSYSNAGNVEDSLYSFRSKQVFTHDNLVIVMNGEKYNNEYIKYVFGFE